MTIDRDLATQFVWTHARLLDRRRFSHEFVGPDPEGVAAALVAYQNADGGFGHALEPDCRAPASQTVATGIALEVLEDVGRLDHAAAAKASAWLASVTTPEGGVPFCLPTVDGYPRAPWWNPEADPLPPNLMPTGVCVGMLRLAGISDTWLDKAEAWCWDALDAQDLNQYGAHAGIQFLRGAADRGRADKASTRLNERLAAGEIVPLDPGAIAADGDTHTPLDIAPSPDHPCRAAFSDEVIASFLDRLESRQRQDGGWPIGWPAPGQSAVLEWRAYVTIDALRTLRAYGRLG